MKTYYSIEDFTIKKSDSFIVFRENLDIELIMPKLEFGSIVPKNVVAASAIAWKLNTGGIPFIEIVRDFVGKVHGLQHGEFVAKESKEKGNGPN